MLWVGIDESLGDTILRLIAMDAADGTVFLQSEFTAGRELDELAEEIAELRPDVVIIDTLSRFAHHLVADENSATEWLPVMQRLRRLVAETDVALVLVHHSKKSESTFRGSSVIAASVDMIVELHAGARDPNSRVLKSVGRWRTADIHVRLSDDGRSFERVDDPDEHRGTEEARARQPADLPDDSADRLRETSGRTPVAHSPSARVPGTPSGHDTPSIQRPRCGR